MIDLYTAGTGNGRRPALMLEECGLAYTVHKIDLARGEQKQPAFLALNPQGTIPVMVDNDGPGGQKLVLPQSAAILLYLADKTGKFLPRDGARRALAYQWLMHAMSDQQAMSGIMFPLDMMPEKPTAVIALLESRLVEYFRITDRRLSEAEFLAGELSIADFALYPLVDRRRPLLDRTNGLEHLRRWMATMAARPAIQRAMKIPG